MKVAIISDQHIGCRNDSQHFVDNSIKFFTYEFFPIIHKENIKIVYHLGDVFDKRKNVNFKVLYDWKQSFFDYLEKYNIELRVILGNHDTYYKNTLVINSVNELLHSYKNIKIYDTITEIPEHDILLCPWINQENQEEFLKKIETSNCHYCFGHFEISGFKMNSGTECNHGMSSTIFNRYGRVLSGHFHHKSQKGNITYVGSPYHMNWGDYGDDRGFHILDLKKDELIFYKNENTLFKRIYYNDFNVEDYESLFVDSPEDIHGKYIKLIVENKENESSYKHFLQKILDSNPADIKIIDLKLYKELENSNIDLTKSTSLLIKEYIQELKLDNEDIVTDFIMNLYNECVMNDVSYD